MLPSRPELVPLPNHSIQGHFTIFHLAFCLLFACALLVFACLPRIFTLPFCLFCLLLVVSVCVGFFLFFVIQPQSSAAAAVLGSDEKSQMPRWTTVRLDEFEQMQQSAMSQLKAHLDETWIPLLKDCVRTSLQRVGKGWFNLEEQSAEVYQFSKLKKFMTRIKYMMEDALRKLARKSLEDYASLIKNAGNYDVVVQVCG